MIKYENGEKKFFFYPESNQFIGPRCSKLQNIFQKINLIMS